MWGFIIGFMCGGMTGVLAMCLLIIGSDRKEEVRDAYQSRKNLDG